MSLLNDMLRDLSAQHKTHQPNEDATHLLADSGLVRNESFPWLLTLTVFGLVLVLALVGQGLWHYWKPVESGVVQQVQESEPVVTPVIPQVIGVEEPVVVSTALPVVHAFEDTSPHFASVEIEQEDQAETALDKVIDQLLQMGDRALARDRLSAPAEDNASHYYAQALALRPGEARAVAGQQAVIQRYLHLVGQALAQQQQARAFQLTMRALVLAPDDSGLLALKQQLETQPLESQSVTQPASVEDSVDTSIPLQVNREPASTPPQQPSSAAVTHSPTASMSILPNPGSRDRQAEQEARNLLQAGDKAGAIRYLEDYLGRDPEAAKASVRLLCHIYLEQGDLARVDQLLNDARDWPVSDHTRLRALWWQAQGNESEARQLLESHLSESENDEAYRALLARLYYNGGEYHQAVTSYRRLLDNFGEKSGYWLGMALALDALGQGGSALVAYERSLLLGPQDVVVTDYIESRMRALSR